MIGIWRAETRPARTTSHSPSFWLCKYKNSIFYCCDNKLNRKAVPAQKQQYANKSDRVCLFNWGNLQDRSPITVQKHANTPVASNSHGYLSLCISGFGSHSRVASYFRPSTAVLCTNASATACAHHIIHAVYTMVSEILSLTLKLCL